MKYNRPRPAFRPIEFRSSPAHPHIRGLSKKHNRPQPAPPPIGFLFSPQHAHTSRVSERNSAAGGPRFDPLHCAPPPGRLEIRVSERNTPARDSRHCHSNDERTRVWGSSEGGWDTWIVRRPTILPFPRPLLTIGFPDLFLRFFRCFFDVLNVQETSGKGTMQIAQGLGCNPGSDPGVCGTFPLRPLA